MLKFLPYVLKTLWRHRTRTLLTVSGAAVALFVFCFVEAIGEGLDRLTSGSDADRRLIVFQANRFCPFTSDLPEDYQRTIEKLPGVERCIPIKVFTNNCRASLDVVVFHGVPPRQLRAARKFELASGNWDDFERHQDGALVGRAVAQRRGLSPGQKFSIGGLSVVVAGVFRAEQPADEDFIYTHLTFLQRARGKNLLGRVTQFEVQVAESADLHAVAAKIDEAFLAAPVRTDTRPRGVFQADSIGDLAQMIHATRYLGYACIGLVLALVATTTLMAVQDRVREHAVLQTLGFSARAIFGLVVSESFLVSLAGGLVGVAAALVTLHLSSISLGAEAVTIAFEPSLSLAITGIVVSLAIGVVAGVAPGWQAARAEIVPALRQV